MQAQIVTNTAKLSKKIAQARAAWEELDPKYTPFGMRKRAEQAYLTLLAMGRKWGVA